MTPKLFAFDLDGTLLDSGKRVRPANAAALRRINESGAAVALASGRLGCGVRRYAPELGIDPALVVLNGAEVYTSSNPGARRVYYAPLNASCAEYLIHYCQNKPVALNFYYDDRLYSAKTDKNAEWTELYYEQTGVSYNFIDKNFSAVAGLPPSKILFVGAPAYLDEQEAHFQAMWGEGGGNAVYVCRTWNHYLEFMNPKATKGIGLAALCDALGINMSEAAAYGDAENDIPMLTAVGCGAAMKNAETAVKQAAGRVTEMTHDEDWVARELIGRFAV
ncbi:MAG: Cof-type HAD-IIB family hydrolase [Chitinispirillales bacterium]|jgi:Cof subfamily protein (haloacid dehalogenase superfamily)|nr:Cof-type HAD-IIB family hydrolase [Chitinispirillales bacterium]